MSNMMIINSIKFLLSQGIDINFNKLSASRIERGLGNNRKIQYQVHSSYKGFVFSHLYDDIDVAIDKFMLIFNIVNGE